MAKKCALPKSVFPIHFKVRSPSHALELARGLIRPFRHWTVKKLATASNVLVPPKSAKAEAFCALGALLRVNTKHAREAEIFLIEAAGGSTRNAIYMINDAGRNKKTHRAVLEMF